MCPQVASSLGTQISCISSFKDTNPIGLEPHPYDPHLTLITFFKGLSPNTITLGIRAQHMEFGVDTIQSITGTSRASISL